MLVAALFAQRRPQGWSVVVPAAVAIASVYSIFSLTMAPWLGVILAAVVVAELVQERDRGAVVRRWVGIAGLTLLLAAPAVASGLTLLRASGGANGPEGLGNLAAPVPGWSSFGPWITSDHRFPLSRYGEPTPTYSSSPSRSR